MKSYCNQQCNAVGPAIHAVLRLHHITEAVLSVGSVRPSPSYTRQIEIRRADLKLSPSAFSSLFCYSGWWRIVGGQAAYLLLPRAVNYGITHRSVVLIGEPCDAIAKASRGFVSDSSAFLFLVSCCSALENFASW